MIVSFSGKYPDGGSGNPIANWMHEEKCNFVKFHSPACVIIDVSDLEYHWGDMIEAVIYSATGNSKDNIPSATVVSEKNRRALSTLEWGNTGQDITELEDVFDSIEEASDYLEAVIEQQTDN